MNYALTSSSIIPQCFDVKEGPGACLFLDGTQARILTDFFYQAIRGYFIHTDSLCSKLKIKPKDCTGSTFFKPFAEIFTRAISGYSTSDNSLQSRFNTYLSRLRYDFHQKSHAVQSELLSKIDQLNSFFIDCTSPKKGSACKEAFEDLLEETEKISFPSQNKPSKISKLLSYFYRTNDSMLLHVLGDSFGRSTGLEGSSHFIAASHLIQFFTFKQLIEPENKQILNARETLIQTLEFSSKFYSSFSQDFCKLSPFDFRGKHAPCFNSNQLGRIQTLSSILKDKLESIEADKPLYLFGGWAPSAVGDGHGVIYKFTKQKNSNLYSFEIINKGDGTEYHFNYYEKGAHKVVPFIGKKNIPLDSLTSATFVSAIYEMFNFYLDYDSTLSFYRSWTQEQLYTLLSDSILKGDFSYEKINSEDWTELQHSGTCAFRSLVTIFDKEMTPVERATFEAELGIWSLMNYISELDFRYTDISTLDFLSKSIHAYSAQLSNNLKRHPHFLSHEDLQEIRHNLQFVQKIVSIFDHQIKYNLNAKIDSLALLRKAAPLKIPSFGIEFDKWFSTSKSNPKFKIQLKFDEISLENLSHSLSEISKELKMYLDSGETDYVILFIQALVKKVHGMNVSKLSEAEKGSSLESLYEISKILFLSSIENPRGYLVMPEKYLAMLKISDLMTNLVTEDQLKELGFDSLSFLFMGFERTVSPSFFFLNPETLLEYERVKKSLVERGYSFDEIPRLFDASDDFFFDEYSFIELKKEHALLTPEAEKSFLSDVLLKSIGHQLKKTDQKSPLWDKTGNFLLKNHEKLLDLTTKSSLLSPLWKRLIQQALMLERLSALYPMNNREDGALLKSYVGDSAAKTDYNWIEDRLRFHLEVKKVSSSRSKHSYPITMRQIPEGNPFIYRIQDQLITRYFTFGASKLLFKQNTHIIGHETCRPNSESVSNALGFMEINALKKQLPPHLLKAYGFKVKNQFDSNYKNPVDYQPETDDLLQITKYDKLRFDRAIAYFENSFNLGDENESYKYFFLNSILISDAVLLEEFSRDQDGPILAHKLASFLKKSFDKAILKENIKAAIFFSSMYRSIKKYYALAQPSLESPFEPIGVLSKVPPLLKDSSTDDLNLALAYGEFFLHLAQEKPEKTNYVSELLSYYFKYSSYSRNYQDSLDSDQDLDYHFNLQHLSIQETIFDKLKILQNRIEQNPAILSEALKTLGKAVSVNDHWEVHPEMGFPYFTCKKKQWTLDLFKGTLESSKAEPFIHALPERVQNHDLYKHLFKNQRFEAKKIGDHEYEFQDSAGNIYQCKMTFGNSIQDKLQLKKISNGNEYFLIGKDTLKDLYEENRHLIPNLTLFEDYRAWISKDKSILFVDPDSLKEEFYYNPSSDQGVINLKTNHALIDPAHTHLNFLSSFELPFFIHVFGKQSNESAEDYIVQSIEFPRLLCKNEPLKFNRLKTGLRCENYPNLFLSNQKSLFYQKTDPVLILEDGHQKPTLALMAPHFFGGDTKITPDRALKTSIPLDFSKENSKARFQLLEYDLIENPDFQADKALQPYLYSPRTREGALYLAFSYLRLHEYQKAFEALLPLKSHMQKFNSAELKTAFSILEMSQFNDDAAPQAYSVKVLLSYILLNQKGDDQLPARTVFEILKNYSSYLDLMTYIDALALSPYEELLLIQSLDVQAEALKSRYKYLSEVIDFSSLDLPASLEITPPKTYSLKASEESLDTFFEFIEKNNLVKLKQDGLSNLGPLSKDFYLSTPYLGSLLNLVTPTSSAHYSPSSIYLPEFFSTLYKIAKETNESESKPLIDLKNYILFLKKVSHKGGSLKLKKALDGFADFLWLVLQKPNRFPSTDEFNEWIFCYEKAKKKDTSLQFITQLQSEAKKVLREVNTLIEPGRIFQNISSIPKPEKEVAPPSQNLDHPLSLKNFSPRLEKELETIFSLHQYSLKATEKTLYDETTKHIQHILSKPLEDSFEKAAFSWTKKDCEFYIGQRQQQKQAFTPMSCKSSILTHVREKNLHLISSQKEVVASLKQDVLELAHKEDADELKKELRKLEEVANREKKLSIHDLMALFQKQSSAGYFRANPALSVSEIELLNNRIANYLVEANFLQKLNRLEGHIRDSLDHPNPAEALQKAVDMALEKRSYDITENPSYLVYEHFADIQLFPKQVEKLSELKQAIESQKSPQEMGLIIEAIMGFGKSKVMLPLLALHISSLGRLPLIVMPDSLIESLGSEIMSTLLPMKERINVIEIQRGSKCSLEELQVLYVKLKLALENHETLIFSGKSLQVLFLKYIEFFTTIASFGDKEENSIRLFQEIFKILNQFAIPIFDEADLLFNCRHETHFSLNNPLFIESNHIETSSLIYKLILENADEIPYNFDFLEFNPKKESLSVAKYHQELKPYLIEKLLKYLMNGDSFKNLNLKEWIESIGDKNILISYLMGVQNNEMDAFIEGIQNEKIAHIIALAQAQLNLFLPMTINKKLLEHYGALKNNSRSYAIPYQHGKAIDQSEFGNPYETINYTIQTYLQQGVPRKILDQEIKVLADQLLELEIQMPGVNLEEFEEYKKMLSIYPHFKGFRITEELLQEAHDYINQSPTEKLWFIQNQILPKIQTYDQRISSNAHTFKMLFNKIIGFTGTMWNAETYPEGIDVTFADGIIGNTITQLIKKSNQEVRLVDKEEDSFEYLDHLIHHKDIKAWIDLSGHFDFIPRLEVVKKILKEKRDQGILGVAFYDENDELMVLHDVNASPIPFAISPLKNSPDKRFTLYDHQRITGADVSQGARAKAVITVGKHLTIRDLTQSAWRMRGLEKGQAVDFITTFADQQAMLSLLNLPKDHTLSVANIIQYAILNQQHKKASDNLLSQKQKIVAVMQEHVFRMLTDQERTPQEVFNLFSKFSTLFVQNISDAPREQFGYPETLQSTEKILKEFILYLKVRYASLFGDDWNSIYEKMNNVIALETMPEKMFARKPISTTALEQNIEIKLNQEIQPQVEREVEESYKVQNKGIVCPINEVASWRKNVFEVFPHPLDLEELLYSQDKESLQLNPKIDIESIMDAQSELKILPYEEYLPEAKAFFSPHILIGNGLLSEDAVYKNGNKIINGMCTERCKEALCFKTSKGLKIIMLDGKSALEWKEFIQSCDDHEIAPTQQASFLFNLETGAIETPSDGSSFERTSEILKSKEFQILKVQTKILSGEIHFKQDEVKLLKEWIEENKIDKEKLRALILDHIIQYFSKQVSNFKKSSLHRLLEEKTDPIKV